jgi:hypothetical protein
MVQAIATSSNQRAKIAKSKGRATQPEGSQTQGRTDQSAEATFVSDFSGIKYDLRGTPIL